MPLPMQYTAVQYLTDTDSDSKMDVGTEESEEAVGGEPVCSCMKLAGNVTCMCTISGNQKSQLHAGDKRRPEHKKPSKPSTSEGQ